MNTVKPFVQADYVYRLVVVADEDPGLLQAKMRLHGEPLKTHQEGELEALLSEFSGILTDLPGETKAAIYEVRTGDHQPIRSPPYQMAAVWKDQVQEEIRLLVESGYVSLLPAHGLPPLFR